MFCGISADTLLCPLPSPPLLHAIDILDSFLGIWHLKNLLWLGDVEGLELGVSATAVRYLSDSRKVQRWSDSLDANPHKLMALLSCPALSHLQRQESTLSGGESSCPWRAPGRCPSGVDRKYLGAWKRPHLFGCIPSHLLRSEFLQGKGDGGKTTGGAAALPAVRKVMLKWAWALLGDIPEPAEASSLVLLHNLPAVGL